MSRRVGALLISIALIGAACSAAEATSPVVGVALPTVTTDVATHASSTSTTTPSAPSTTVAPTTTVAQDPHLTLIATAKGHVTNLVAFDEPDGERVALPFLVPNPHQFGGPLTLMVVDGQPGDEWLQVQLPVRPNEQVGWVDASDYVLSSTRVRAEVHLGAAAVKVFDGGELIAESAAVVGSEENPTPLGTFYVAAKKENTPEEFWLGPWALVLSSFSEVLLTFSGGLPVIAVHGTNHPELMGEAITFGCVRVPNDVIEFLAEHVPVGAPVIVSA